MAKTLTAHEQPLSRVLSDEYVFSIPGYQRPYAWAAQQARELFDDLVGFMSVQGGDVNEMPPYFLGSIVLIKKDDSPEADVVDGQQRLTTLTLLLSAIRSTLDAANAAYVTPLIHEQGNPIKGTQDRFRLSLRERDAKFFQRYVQRAEGFEQLLVLKDELSDSQRNLKGNATLFQELLERMTQQERLRLAQFAVTRCFLVVVATPDLDAAYRIFSVLNSRGLDLAATDILKAQIIGSAPEGQRELQTERWEDIEEDLGREEFGELFSHIRMVYRKAKPKGTLLKEFVDHVPEVKTPHLFIERVLVPTAEAYQEITDASYSSVEQAGSVNETLKWLDRLEFTDWVPPALAFFVRNRQRPDAMQRFFANLERLAFSMLVRGAGINERIERCSLLTGSIEHGVDLYVSSSPLQLTDTEKHLTRGVLDGPVYSTLAARARTLLLLRLDSLLSGGGAHYDRASVTVEHVLPQTPAAGSEWVKWFPDTATRQTLVDRLGNLALLTRKKNSAASNFDFEKKKTAYFTNGGVSPFSITTQVLQHSSWTEQIILSRQSELLKKLADHWRL